ncbi:Na+/H+ antiporter NhaC family protein [Metabacillus sp. GX 13764]|uniref:Na+/H+ antiporter NhaC family protein n=1 Tax=Metabacillus kandeliae TaxID=2900151 RepID=UPI001E5CEA58|nr:Na+/H+ antiporter NhaC family protein [Metabacillus kandeliae]MCD7035169.1 Na+/H+ antiporter NhaC family protein [Metabacillus kandeliae]
MTSKKASPLALLPLAVFIGLFLLSGIITGDFYKMPIVVATMAGAAAALIMNRKESFTAKVERFSKGAGHPDIMIMVLIYILAGAFSEVAKGMGAVDATVNLAMSIMPGNLLAVGLFVIAAFVSLSMGTSMGAIAAIGPIAAGISGQTEIPAALSIAAVIGGAMFGDNLSFISDTTIAAVRSQQTEMKDKFKTNFFIVLPAAIAAIFIIYVMTMGITTNVDAGSYSWIKIIPYLAVLITALLGFNVVAVISGGIVFAGVIGLADGSYTLSTLLQKIPAGITNMFELVILSILIGGMVELIRHNGGIQWIMESMSKRIKSKRGAEFGIAGLVSTTNLAVANNTISIITTGPLARNISEQYKIDRKKSASILDIFSCAVQGLIPYGAQMLTASQMAKVSPLAILPYTVYPMLIAVCGIIAIITNYPRFSPAKEDYKEAREIV